MKERGILFNGPMVRAILAGTKTQTRRVVKPQPKQRDGAWYWAHPRYDNGMGVKYFHTGEITPSLLEAMARCYGQPGDRLWVRETFCIGYSLGRGEYTALPFNGCEDHRKAFYRADGGDPPDEPQRRWRPAIHMPRWASRITLEITGVRVERLQDISEQDARAEGCSEDDKIRNALVDPVTGKVSVEWEERAGSAREAFCNLWQHINRRRYDEPTSWEENPYVWVVEFRRDAK